MAVDTTIHRDAAWPAALTAEQAAEVAAWLLSVWDNAAGDVVEVRVKRVTKVQGRLW